MIPAGAGPLSLTRTDRNAIKSSLTQSLSSTQTKHINSSTFPGFHSVFKAKQVNSSTFSGFYSVFKAMTKFQHFSRQTRKFQHFSSRCAPCQSDRKEHVFWLILFKNTCAYSFMWIAIHCMFHPQLTRNTCSRHSDRSFIDSSRISSIWPNRSLKYKIDGFILGG